MNRVLEKIKIISYFDCLQEILADDNSDNSVKILKERNLLEAFYQDITNDFRETFPNLYSRLIYANEYYGIEQDLQANLNGVRIFLNKVIHNEIHEFSSRKVQSVLYYLYKLICHFTDARLEELEKVFQEMEIVSFTKIKKSLHQQIDHISMSVSSYELIQQDDKTFKSQIIGYELDGEEQIKVLVWDLKTTDKSNDKFIYGKKIGSIAKLLWPGCKLSFFNLKQNVSDTNVYFTQSTTKIVLEPDFLIDASTIAKCFQNNNAFHKMAVLSLFDKVNNNIPIVTGNFVNQMLDKMIVSSEQDFEQLFKESVHNSVLTSLSLGIKNLLSIMRDVKEKHYPNLQKLCTRLQDVKITTEATFYAPEYGLFGRLDGLLEDETEDGKRHSIFELKSGSLPKYGVWINHAVQVYIYDMLLNSLFGNSRSGSSMIFYSQDKNAELRNVAPAPYMEQHILMLRNCIVSEFKAFAEGEIDIAEYFSNIELGKLPTFTQGKFLTLKNNLENLTLEERTYFNHYLSFLFREIWAIKTGYYTRRNSLNSDNNGVSSLWKSTLLEKRENAKVITDLVFSELKENLLIFKRENISKTNSLREGDRTLLYLYTNKINSQVLKCSIEYIDAKEIHLLPKNAEINKDLFDAKDRWTLEVDSGEASIFSLITSLSDFIMSSKENRELLLGNREARFESNLCYQDADDYLNPIIEKALSAKDYFLLQGPPGTGKTSSFLLKCLKYLAENSTENILILAFTNRAIDEVCIKLNNARLSYLRLGNNKNDDINSLSEICNKEDKLQQIANKLENYRIFCSTVAAYHANKEALHNIISFDTLFVDEASQLIEPELIGITKNFQRFILIGDQNQLPAISIQSEDNQKCKDNLMNKLAVDNYRQSLFERLFTNAKLKGWTSAFHTLTYHYRMHEHIADLINHNYYYKLQTRIERQSSNLFLKKYSEIDNPIQKRILAKSRCIFIDLPDKRHSNISQLEARAIAKLLNSFKLSYPNSPLSDKLGVICNWRSQINLIKELSVGILNDNEITIDTVERYQGSERDVIIYSLTVNYHHQLDILQSLTANRRVDRKLNVALSRSREQILILGNAKVLSALPQYADLIAKIKSSFLYITYNEAKELLLET